MEQFITHDPDPDVEWEGGILKLSKALPLVHTQLLRFRVPPFEADELVSILVHRLWTERAARALGEGPARPAGCLRIAPGEVRRLANALILARRRTAACDDVRDYTLRGDQVLSAIGLDGADPDWWPDPRPGPPELAELDDMKRVLYRAVARTTELPMTKQRAYEVLQNAPHGPPKYARCHTTRARAALRKVYEALFGPPGLKEPRLRCEPIPTSVIAASHEGPSAKRFFGNRRAAVRTGKQGFIR